MKKVAILFTFLIAALMLPAVMQAQRNFGRDRESWMKEIQQYKNDFIAKKLELTDEQRAKFLPL